MLAGVCARIQPPDEAARGAAADRHATLTKPAGSLGRLEDLGLRLAAIAGACPPPVPREATVVVAAADHGVHAQAVTPWPQRVTAQMVAGVAAGTAAVSVLAREVGAAVVVLDVGVAGPVPAAAHVLSRRVRAGTADLSRGPAMARTEAVAAMRAGAEVGLELVAAGAECLLTGDLGIANTTASAALVAAFTGAPAERVTGRGTGVDDATWERKAAVVAAALDRHRPTAGDPLGVLACVGGLEHGALAGLILAAAASRVPVVLDGVIAGAAALVAAEVEPASIGYCVAGHLSPEPGHAMALRRLGLEPLLDLDLRLGEGTGAVLALPLLRCAAAVLGQMATFDSAGISPGSR